MNFNFFQKLFNFIVIIFNDIRFLYIDFISLFKKFTDILYIIIFVFFIFLVFIYFFLFLIPSIFFLFFIYLLNLFYLFIFNKSYDYDVYSFLKKIQPRLNTYKYIFYIYCIQHPILYSYSFFYFFICFIKYDYIIFDKNFYRNYILLTFFYKNFIKLLIIIPYFIIRVPLDLTIKFKNLNSFEYKSGREYLNTLVLNYSLMYVFGLGFFKNSIICVNNRKIKII